MIRLGPGNISLLGSGAHRAGGGKIRLGDFLLRGEALTGLEVERSVSVISGQGAAGAHDASWCAPTARAP